MMAIIPSGFSTELHNRDLQNVYGCDSRAEQSYRSPTAKKQPNETFCLFGDQNPWDHSHYTHYPAQLPQIHFKSLQETFENQKVVQKTLRELSWSQRGKDNSMLEPSKRERMYREERSKLDQRASKENSNEAINTT